MSDKKLYGVFSLEAYSTLPPIQLRVGKTLLKVEANGSRYSTPAEKAGCAELQKHLPSSVRALVRTALTEYERIKNTSGTREN